MHRRRVPAAPKVREDTLGDEVPEAAAVLPLGTRGGLLDRVGQLGQLLPERNLAKVERHPRAVAHVVLHAVKEGHKREFELRVGHKDGAALLVLVGKALHEHASVTALPAKEVLVRKIAERWETVSTQNAVEDGWSAGQHACLEEVSRTCWGPKLVHLLWHAETLEASKGHSVLGHLQQRQDGRDGGFFAVEQLFKIRGGGGDQGARLPVRCDASPAQLLEFRLQHRIALAAYAEPRACFLCLGSKDLLDAGVAIWHWVQLQEGSGLVRQLLHAVRTLRDASLHGMLHVVDALRARRLPVLLQDRGLHLQDHRAHGEEHVDT
mmetsp:Transcript_45954/g.103262  ORF Transcript_45954/g.103262 Transcript_45954/m.103262 type:complete len:322 (+) Transcript_45954:794-1759(+)